ncbi:uncharacterized protein N7484_008783 [Penicillium longicatenatum]|uniref:uncharacterized protein n=1 Tax=Penicillium longicatenatum TaxID=1561947 RepID=UPI0025499A45|nr:uncharacterized protein N7484_008783 [Penicillium longicatenatum]KAJ5635470.1 hypothetical protein N7484_008783 [Penicillium longicatenatum]
MGGLRGLLCCKGGNPNDDDQNLANRPVEKPSVHNGNTQIASNVPGNGQKPGSSNEATDEHPEMNSKEKSHPRNLWKEAYDGLDQKTKENIPAIGVSVTDAIQGVIKTTQENYEAWQKGGLRYHSKGGKEYDIRAATEKIFGIASKAKDVVSTFVSFDPTGHASSAWTIVSFGMSIVQNNLDRRDAVFASSEFLTEHLTYFALIDARYRDKGVGSDSNVDQALIRVYSAMLSFTAEVRKARDENEAKRMAKSIFQFTDQSLSTLKVVVKEQKEALKEWQQLAADLINQENAKKLLADSDQLLENTKNIESKLSTEEQKTQLQWLSSAKFSTRHDLLVKKRVGNTGLWLLDSQEYSNWMATSGSLLWLPGISGCGKSVLCSTVIHELKDLCGLDKFKYHAYWYFEFGVDWTKSVDALIRSLIRQLSRPPLAPSVVNLYTRHYVQGSEPDSEEILKVLHDLLSKIPEKGQVYLVFDALDECPNNGDPNERESLLALLMDLLERHNNKIHILATSRPESDITHQLGGFPSVDLAANLAEDVKTFVNVALTKDPLRDWNDGIKNLIRDKLLSFKERRFRWAELQIEELKTHVDENELKKALDSVPPTLEETYRKVLEGIKKHNVAKARDMLMLICLSPVALDVHAVVKMTKVRGPNDVVTICTTSLVSLNDSTIQLAHFSVQEYLIVKLKEDKHHECHFTEADGHKYLTEKTVDLLLAQTEYITEEKKALELPHFLYAAKHWDYHLAAAGGFDKMSPELQVKINRLFTDSEVYVNWVRGADSDDWHARNEWSRVFSTIEEPDEHADNEWSKVFSECEGPIHRASVMGLVHTVDALLQQGADPLEPYTCSHPEWRKAEILSSFGIAARVGNLDILQSLLDKRLPLEKQSVVDILRYIDYRRAGKAKLAQILQTLLDQDLLRDKLIDAPDTISDLAIWATLQNKISVTEIMNVFLCWSSISIPITDSLVAHSITTMPSASLTKLLFEKCDIRVPPEVVEDLEQGSPFKSTASLTYLALERPHELPVSDGLVKAFARYEDTKVMKFLLETQKEHIHVTNDVLRHAAANPREGDMLDLLWPLRDPGTLIDEFLLMDAASNQTHQYEYLSRLLHEMELDLSLSPDFGRHFIETILEADIETGQGVETLQMLLDMPNLNLAFTEETFQAICQHPKAVEMMDILKERGINVPLTELIVAKSIANETRGLELFNYLVQISTEPLKITDMTILGAAANPKAGAEIFRKLVQAAPDSAFTDNLFQEIVDAGHANALAGLLDQKRREPPLEMILEELASPSQGVTSADMLEVLLERDLVKADEHTVEMLSRNFHCLRTLLSWNRHVTINQNALMEAVGDLRSIRLVMAAQENHVEIPDDALRLAIINRNLEVLEAIIIRQESLADKIIWLAAENGELSEGQQLWLLQRPSESWLKGFWQHTWRDPDFPAPFRACLLIAYLLNTKEKVTEDLLEECSYDSEDGENYGFDMLVTVLCWSDEISDPPATERAAEIIAERCIQEVVLRFLDHTRVPITENVIRAAEKSRQQDVEETVEILRDLAG